MASRKQSPFPDFIQNTVEVLRPPEELTVSQWAEKHRVLDTKTSAIPGRWSNDITPYMVEIMDCVNDPYIEQIVFVKPTQVGGTEVILNAIGYLAGQDPRPVMVVEPTDKLAKSVSDNRLKPMFQLSSQLAARFRELESSQFELQCEGMYVSLNGANSPANLASKPIGVLMLDEVDKYPGATNKEADPVSLAIERTKTYTNRKIYMCSTPTIRGNHIWQAKERAEGEKHYFVPCPHCDEMIELIFDQIKFPSGEGLRVAERAEMSAYVCQECGGIITDAQKGMMLRRGEWRYVRKERERVTNVCYWINTLYSPFVTFGDVAKEFLISKTDTERLQNFKNSWLAEPWEDRLTSADADMVLAQQSEYARWEIPAEAWLLTAGVDVQRDSVYWTIRAWGNNLTSWNIAHGQALSLADIVPIMNRPYRRQDGTEMLVALCCVDSGDQTDDVYSFCLAHPDWTVSVKGASSPVNHYRISTINKAGVGTGIRLVLVDGGRYKDTIAARLRVEGRGAWMVHAECDQDYAEQVTAEHKVNVKKGGALRSEWKPKTSHAANHYLDAEVYAFVAADLRQVRTAFLREEEDD